jgi:hypothetical protein
MGTQQRSSQILLSGIGVAVIALLVIAIVLAVQPTPQLDPASPEGTVQRYFQAVLDGDDELASSYLTSDLGDRCGASEFRHRSDEDLGVVIVDTEARGDQVRVDVEITETYGSDPFGDSSYTFQETFILKEEAGRWLIAERPWPDPYCQELSQ